MNEMIKIFENRNLGRIRVVLKNGQPWFCLKDICDILGVGNPSQLAKRLNHHGVISNEVMVNAGFGETLMNMNFVNEENLYATIFQSRKPIARDFQQWVFGEVLPSIRQNGFYNVDWYIPKTYGDALALAGEKQKEVERLSIENNNLLSSYNELQSNYEELEDENHDLYLDNQIMQPKAEFYDVIIESPYGYSMGEVAKILKYDKLGRNKIFKILREHGILDHRNLPYQKYVNQNLFKVRVTHDANGGTHLQTTILMKGIEFINSILDKSGYELGEDR